MKKFVLVLFAAIAVSAFAADTTIKGYLVDRSCSAEKDFKAEQHSKDCLQMAECEGSGYAIVTADNKVIKLDAKGNETAKKLIAGSKKDADFKASASGTLEGDKLTVESLTLE